MLVDDKILEKIMLDDKHFVEIPKEISFGLTQELNQTKPSSDTEAGFLMLKLMIKNWNLTLDGKIAEINDENLKKLPIKAVNQISCVIQEKMILDKKK